MKKNSGQKEGIGCLLYEKSTEEMECLSIEVAGMGGALLAFERIISQKERMCRYIPFEYAEHAGSSLLSG